MEIRELLDQVSLLNTTLKDMDGEPDEDDINTIKETGDIIQKYLKECEPDESATSKDESAMEGTGKKTMNEPSQEYIMLVKKKAGIK